ncbi:MAG: acetyl-CoA synthase subunit gamma [Spirochaetes bacterium]|nr:acetyl-CoA synthase subunit gamma [Spirochaetota bacterium]
MKNKYIINTIKFKGKDVPVISWQLNFSDIFGAVKVRLGIKRDHYRINPGLYALGTPDKASHVFVSANYKLSFDSLRSKLKGINAWILVLDTKGVNVWCAAGKGTFGTDELNLRIKESDLAGLVAHRRLIVPQLGATGVAGHLVKKHSGFSVTFGPVRSSDIPDFLKNGLKATPIMRRVQFPLQDRVVLVPMELVTGFKYLLLIIIFFFMLGGLSSTGYSFTTAIQRGILSSILLLSAYFSGAVLGPILLPWLPGRSFSIKGLFAGFIVVPVLFLGFLRSFSLLEIISWSLIIPLLSSFLTMNFTGASTYTSLSGVKKEMCLYVPIQIIGVIGGFVLWMIDRFIR